MADRLHRMGRRLSRVLAAYFGLAALSACAPQEQARQVPSDALEATLRASFSCRVGKIVDGDTFDCLGAPRVRLFAIQSPERGEALWRDARLALVSLIDRKTLECFPQDTDRHGRTVALCFAGNADVGAGMVSKGVAASCPAFSNRYEALDTGRVPRPAWCER